MASSSPKDQKQNVGGSCSTYVGFQGAGAPPKAPGRPFPPVFTLLQHRILTSGFLGPLATYRRDSAFVGKLLPYTNDCRSKPDDPVTSNRFLTVLPENNGYFQKTIIFRRNDPEMVGKCLIVKLDMNAFPTSMKSRCCMVGYLRNPSVYEACHRSKDTQLLNERRTA